MPRRIATTPTILTALQSTKAASGLSTASRGRGVGKSRIFLSDGNGHTRVPKASPSQTLERGDFPRHEVEQAFDGRVAVLAGDMENQLMEEFPFRPGVAGRFHGLHEFLDAALA